MQVTEHREALKSFEATHDGLKQQYEDVKSENEVLYRRAAKYRQKLVDAGMVLGKVRLACATLLQVALGWGSFLCW
jgi:hypothetical protein